MTWLADTATLAGGRGRRIPLAQRTLQQIWAIPHTVTMRGRIAAVEQVEQNARADGRELRALEEILADALERDELASARPDGCWCYGRGGDLERGLMVPGGDVPMVLSIYCTCPDSVARRAEDDQFREAARAYAEQRRIQGLWEAAKIPDRFNGCTLATFPVTTPKMRATVGLAAKWLQEPAWALVLLGDYGVGKTGLGIGLLRAAAERRMVGLFVKAPDLLSRVRATYGKNSDATELEVLESLRNVPLLMLDDLGADKETDWATAMLFQILDARHDENRKTIVTTNLSVPDLALHIGERTMHRFEEDAIFHHMEGPNLRKDHPKGDR